MKLSDFKYNLPKTAIAKYPVSPRDKSKLMVLNKETGDIYDKKFTDVIDYMDKGDVLVVNETRVFQARLYGKKEKTNAKIEVFLLRELNKEDCIWDVIVDPARKVRIGNKIYFDNNLWCEVIDNTTSRGRTVRFNQPGNVFQAVEKIGLTPLPPYIKENRNQRIKKIIKQFMQELMVLLLLRLQDYILRLSCLIRLKRKEFMLFLLFFISDWEHSDRLKWKI